MALVEGNSSCANQYWFLISFSNRHMNQRRILNFLALFGTVVGISLTVSSVNNQQVAFASSQNVESNAIETVENSDRQMLIARRRRRRSRGCSSQLASFYGRSNRLTAAHRTLPFGTRVRVTNRRNGRSVVVRINDRGPFIRCRIIDVSLGAARRLGMIRAGVVPVSIRVLGR